MLHTIDSYNTASLHFLHKESYCSNVFPRDAPNNFIKNNYLFICFYIFWLAWFIFFRKNDIRSDVYIGFRYPTTLYPVNCYERVTFLNRHKILVFVLNNHFCYYDNILKK